MTLHTCFEGCPCKLRIRRIEAVPRTAEEWANWAYDQMPKTLQIDFVVEAIRRAQEQARCETIAECAKLAEIEAEYAAKNNVDDKNGGQCVCDNCQGIAKEPRTAEEWLVWFKKRNGPDADPDNNFIDVIRALIKETK